MHPQAVPACRAVKEFADNYKQSGKKLHCLINNAGTALPPHSTTKDGFEVQQPQLSVVHWAQHALLHAVPCERQRITHAHTRQRKQPQGHAESSSPPAGDFGIQLLWASVLDEFAA